MSLISDALRKARQEAAEREAKERGMESPIVAGYWKRGGRLGVGLILGAAIAMAAAVIGGGLVWWALTDRPEPTVAEVPDDVEQAAVEIIEVPPETSNRDPVPDQAREAMASTVTPVESKVGENPVSPPDGDSPPAAADVPDRAPDREEGVPSEVPSPEPQRQLADGEFVGEAQVGDVTLTLDYLVFRKENPFAQINGQDVRVGAVVEDFVVKEITADSVVLAKGDTRIVLRVQ